MAQVSNGGFCSIRSQIRESRGNVVDINGWRKITNWVMARNTKGSWTARRDDIDQGLWILGCVSSCSKFLIGGFNCGYWKKI